jgi:hypothetical protein
MGSTVPFGSSAGRTVRMEDKQNETVSVAIEAWTPASAVLYSDNVLELSTRRGWVLLSECPERQEMQQVTRSRGNTVNILTVGRGAPIAVWS